MIIFCLYIIKFAGGGGVGGYWFVFSGVAGSIYGVRLLYFVFFIFLEAKYTVLYQYEN